MEIGAILFYEDIENDLEDIVNGEIKWNQQHLSANAI
jgi:hypothetical protein